MHASSVMSSALNAWRVAVMDAKRAAHELARLQAQQMRDRYPDGVRREVAEPPPPSRHADDPPDRGRYVDMYDSPR